MDLLRLRPSWPFRRASVLPARTALVCTVAFAAGFAAPWPAAAQDPRGLWSDVDAARVTKAGQVWVNASRSRTLRLDLDSMARRLAGAPLEFTVPTKASPVVITLPMPDGTFADFASVASPIMEPPLADAYPQVRTYAAAGLDDPTATARLDITPQGFHALILSVHGSVYIDPLQRGDVEHYRCYAKADASRLPEEMPFEIGVVGADSERQRETERLASLGLVAVAATGTHLRTYRLAVAATGEYTSYHGGAAPALAAIVTAVNRVTGIYEREVSLRMVLVANNNLLVYTNSGTDPYTNSDPFAMLGENQSTIDAVIGNTNYDIGHVFGTAGGGVASLSVPCRTALKARGVSTLSVPNGDPFHVDFVAHEMGHQWGAQHTFNGNTGSCAANISPSSAYEPGSGSTFMAYTGLCPGQNIQTDADDYMHTRSFDQMESYSVFGSGNACAVTTATGNDPPVPVAGTGGFVIPILTPFELTGSATDANGDTLTYCWEQFDLGPAGAPDAPSGNAPIFRSFPPVLSPTRVFPRLQDLLNNTSTLGEILPSYSRTLTFRLTARDNRGGVARDQIAFSATAAAGPFVMVSPNTTGIVWVGGTAENVTWNVAGTSAAPVSAANVDILMSLDGGLTYPTVLASSTPNDGSQSIVVPALLSDSVRVKVKAAANVFFDISDHSFRVLPSMPAPVVLTGVTPSVGYENTTEQLVVLGEHFNQFHTADLGAGIEILDVDPTGGDTLLVDVHIETGAVPGPRDLIVDDLVAADTLFAAFEVRTTTRHYVSPTGGNVFPYQTPANAALTVANAVNAATAGDSILVDSATINGTFSIQKGVVLYGGWTNNFTARDVDNVKTVVNLTAGILIAANTGTAGIDGFVLQGGDGATGFVPITGRYGGAVQILNTPSARVTNCVLQDNIANALNGFGGGGALFAINSGVEIADNEFTGNTATRGGGLFLYSCAGAVSGNSITGNVLTNDGINTPAGAGIALEQCTNVTLSDNVVAANTGASTGGGLWMSQSSGVAVTGGSMTHHTVTASGGGIHVAGSAATVTGVEIRHNTSAFGGGGVACDSSSVLTLQANRLLWNIGVLGGGVNAAGGDVSLLHNLFVGNRSNSGGGARLENLNGGEVAGNTFDRNRGGTGGTGTGGIFLIDNTVDVFNNIITNTAGTGVRCSGGAVTLTYNLVSNSSIANYNGCAPGIGSIGGAALFADTTLADYHLTLNSPAIDAGRPEVLFADPDGSRGDMGWYGSHAFAMDQPAFPTGLVAADVAGNIVLNWERNPEPDVDVYAVYCDTLDGFVPSVSNFVGTTADTTINLGAATDTLYYCVSAVDSGGYAGGYSAQATLVPDDASSGPVIAPLAYRLAQNVPNPFNPDTVIAFSIAHAGRVKLFVYDVAGRIVRRLLDDQRPPGEYRVRWDGRADDGRSMPSGHYYYRLELDGDVRTRTMVLLK